MSLSELSYTIRKMLPLVLIGVLMLAIFFVLFQILIIALTPAPAAPEPEKPKDKLNRTVFEYAVRAPAGKKYILDTYSGVPDPATKSAKVIFKPKDTPTFGAKEKARLLSRSFGFDDKTVATKLDAREIIFTDSIRRLKMNLDSFNYEYTREADDIVKTALDTKNIFVPEYPATIEQQAITLMAQFGKTSASLSTGTRKIFYFDYNHSSDSATLVQTAKEANMIEVDFFPSDLMGLPVHYERFYTSPHHIVYIPTGKGLYVLKAQMRMYEPSLAQATTYPLKTADQAFEELKAGRGILGSGSLTGMDTVHIKRMFVGYIEPEAYTEYMQPYFIFVDDRDVAVYVPAIVDEWLNPEKQETRLETPSVVQESTDVTATPSELPSVSLAPYDESTLVPTSTPSEELPVDVPIPSLPITDL